MYFLHHHWKPIDDGIDGSLCSRADVDFKSLNIETSLGAGDYFEHPIIIQDAEGNLLRGIIMNRDRYISRRTHDTRIHANDLLPYANYNDEPDPAVKATVEQLVDTSKIVEVERIDHAALPKKRVYRFIKRTFDIVSCAGALVLCAIPMGIIAIVVKRDSPGPVLYRQERLGYMGKPIVVTKFRSMRTDAEKMGAQWTQGDDPRVTKTGAFLRKTRLDELPQFWAVIKGDMSLVGPRPEREVFYREFEQHIHGFSQRMMVKPGITGLAQVNGGYDLLPAEKVQYDLDYIKNQSISMDWKIIWKTFGVLFSHEGAR